VPFAPKRRWSQFSIRELILLILAAGIGSAWWVHHARLMEKVKENEPNFGGVKPRIVVQPEEI